MEWQPIETAPKDRRILCYNGMVGIYTSQWQPYLPEGETQFPCGFWTHLGKWFCVPSHWAELPKAPE